MSLVTGLDRADFTTHQARRLLARLGFSAARRQRSTGLPAKGAGTETSSYAEALRPYLGQWVATDGDEVLVGADTAAEVVSWLARHERRADSLFRVPVSEIAAGGAAPS